MVRLGEVCDNIINGSTPLKSVREYWNAKDIHWATIEDFSNLYITNTKQYISKKGLEKVRVVPINSVLLSCTATIGKTAINKIELTTNQQINGIVCNKSIIPEYLAHFLDNYSSYIASLSENVGVKHINLTMLKSFKLPLPPLTVQEEIVKEITEIEAKETKAKEVIERNGEGMKNLCKISDKPTKLYHIAQMIKRGKSPKYGFSKVQIIKSGQVRGLYEFDFSTKHYVSKDFILDDRKLLNGDILINSTGTGTAGRVNLFNLESDCVVDSHITIVRLDTNKSVPKYILYSLWTIGFENIEKMATGQSGQIEISKEIIENIQIPLPPLEEQKKIIAKVEPLEKEIAEAKSFLSNAKNLKQDILDKYLK
jgi:type I restriction enzyme M protein